MTDWVSTTCMRCAVGCGHRQRGVDRGYGIDVVAGDATHPVNQGLACQRGIEETADPGGEWLTRPLVRRDGDLMATTWDVALSRVAEAFRPLLAEDPDSVAVLGSGQQTNEAAYALGKLARGGFGTRFYDANTTLCMASAVTAYYRAFGSDAPPPTYEDIPEADTHVVWGANPAAAHPVMFRWIRESADDGQLVVVDPVETETAQEADHHVRPDPGGDLVLAQAVLARAVETDAVDEAFVDEHTEGFDALVDSLADPAAAAEEAGVDLATVDRLVDALDYSTLVYWGMGVNQSVRGTATSRALVDLCLATGNMGPGSGPFSLTGQANSMGTRVCSSKGTWPGHRDFEAPDERRVVADHWDVPVERLPDETGPGPVGILDAVEDGPVEAIYAVATNPAAGMPDAARARERLDDAFLVVQDAFRSETVEHADVVLPAATWGESAGTVMNLERTVSRVRPASDLAPDVHSDLDIVGMLARRLCSGLFDGALDPAEVFDEFAALTEGTLADCSGIDYDRLDAEMAVRWPAPTEDSAAGYRYHDDGDWTFPTPSGRARFSPPDATTASLPEPTDETYPLTLTNGRAPDGYNTGVRTREGPDDADPLVARVHPETFADHLDPAAERGRLATRRGSVTAEIEVDPAVPRGLVWTPIHHPMTNDLTIAATDPDSDEPNFKQCAVRLAPVEAEGPDDETEPLLEAAE